MLFIIVCLSLIVLLEGGGLVGVAITVGAVILFFAILTAILSIIGERDLNRRGYKTVTRTRRIRHKYYDGGIIPWYIDEIREEDVIVPLDYNDFR